MSEADEDKKLNVFVTHDLNNKLQKRKTPQDSRTIPEDDDASCSGDFKRGGNMVAKNSQTKPIQEMVTDDGNKQPEKTSTTKERAYHEDNSNKSYLGWSEGATPVHVTIRTRQQEIASLSPNERNRILESMHGVRNDKEEEQTYYRGIVSRAGGTTTRGINSTGLSTSRQVQWSLSSEKECGSWSYFAMRTTKNDFGPTLIVQQETGQDVDAIGDIFYPSSRPAKYPPHFNGQDDADHPTTEDVVPNRPHGKEQDGPMESGRFILDKLEELDEALAQIHKKDAYDLSLKDFDDCVKDPKFRLVFLRADSFNATKAASRLVAFMEEKLKRFGSQTLTRQLTIDDLSASAKSLLVKKGVVQLLPVRDSSGRAIMASYYRVSHIYEELCKDPKSLVSPGGTLVAFPKRGRFYMYIFSHDRCTVGRNHAIWAGLLCCSLLQPNSSYYQGDAVFYLISTMAEDQETQRRGIVTVGVIASSTIPQEEGPEMDDDLNVFLHASIEDLGVNLHSWCPVKCNAHHHWIYDDNSSVVASKSDFSTDRSSVSMTQEEQSSCVVIDDTRVSLSSDQSKTSSSDISGSAVYETILRCLGKDYRIRTRLHEGSYESFNEDLKTFGIPVDHLPYSMDGSEIRTSGAHNKWLQKRRQKEVMLILNRGVLTAGGSSRRAMASSSSSTTSTISSGRGRGASSSSKRKRGGGGGITNSSPYFDVIDIPGRHDICLGRGSSFHQHTGNIDMRAMMEPLVGDYGNATSTRRQELNRVIMKAIELVGGRFLTNQTSDGAWFEVVTDQVLIEKTIAAIFRSMVSRKNSRDTTGTM